MEGYVLAKSQITVELCMLFAQTSVIRYCNEILSNSLNMPL